MYILVFAGLALLGALIQMAVSRRSRTTAYILETLLLWALILNGFMGFFAFLGHVFQGPQIARFIGWPPGNPFQFEVGIANLGVAALGFLAIWRRGEFWLATIVMMTVFYWGAAVGHIIQIVQFQNFAPGNAGAVLYSDIIMPAVLIGLYVAYKISAAREKTESPVEYQKKAA